MLRIRKVIQYLAEKINILVHPSCIGSSSKSEDKGKFIELYCNGKVFYPFIQVVKSKTDIGNHQVRTLQRRWCRFSFSISRAVDLLEKSG